MDTFYCMILKLFVLKFITIVHISTMVTTVNTNCQSCFRSPVSQFSYMKSTLQLSMYVPVCCQLKLVCWLSSELLPNCFSCNS